MEQRCTILNLYLNWLLYLGGLALFLWMQHYLWLAMWAVATPLFQMAYVRVFPRLSPALGYGTVADTPAGATGPAPVAVTLYTAAGCPFCPIVEQRLRTLEQAMGFTLRTVDVTVRPDLLASKRIKAVPVVEVGDESRTGNLTSQQLAALIAGCAAGANG